VVLPDGKIAAHTGLGGMVCPEVGIFEEGEGETEDFVLELCIAILEPVGKRSPLTTSRLAVLKDGTTAPVLALLCERKFGAKLPEGKHPFWMDGNYRNELLSNVDLATAPTLKRERPTPNRFGVPSGSREYMRRWREENRENVRAAQKRYAQRKRDVLKAVAAAVPTDDPVLAKLHAAVHEKDRR